MRYIIIGAISFLASVALTFLFLFYGRSLLLEGSDKAMVYLVILVPLGLCCSFLLFRVLRSYGKLTGKIFKQNVIVSGPAFMFVAVMAIGYYFYSHPPVPSEFVLTIAFQDSLSQKPLDGTATVTYNSGFETQKFVDGKIHWANVHPNSVIKVDPHVAGYLLNGSHNFLITGSNTTLAILMVPLREQQILREQVLAQFTAYTNNYYNRAYNLADFMQTNSKYLFVDTGQYFEQFSQDITEYNKSFDTLFALGENLSKSIAEFAPSSRKDAQEFMSQFESHHQQFFKNFLNERQDTLISYAIINKMTDPMRKNLILRMQKNGQDTLSWLQVFKTSADQIKNALSL